MERQEFLKSIGKGAAFALTFACLGGCLKEDPFEGSDNSDTGTGTGTGTGTNNNILFSLDLSASTSNNLKNNGGYVIQNNVVVAKDNTGNYVAATVVCSHDLLKKVTFRNNEFYCTEHGARFNLSGTGLNNDGRRGLKIYATSLDGNTLNILS